MNSTEFIAALLSHQLAECNQSRVRYFGDAIDVMTASAILHDTVMIFTARQYAASAGMADHFLCDVAVSTDEGAKVQFNWTNDSPTASLLYPFVTHTFLSDVMPYLTTDLVFYLEDAWKLVDLTLAQALASEIAEAGISRQEIASQPVPMDDDYLLLNESQGAQHEASQ